MPSITAFAYTAVADKLGLDPKNEAAAIAKYLEPNSSFRAQVESFIDEVYTTVAAEFDDDSAGVIENEGSIDTYELDQFICRQKQTLRRQLQDRYDREFKPNWVVTVSWAYPGEFEVTTGQTFKETKLVRAESRGQAAEKAYNACSLHYDYHNDWYQVDHKIQEQVKLLDTPECHCMLLDEWIAANTVLA
jgi:hypothetical protein